MRPYPPPCGEDRRRVWRSAGVGVVQAARHPDIRRMPAPTAPAARRCPMCGKPALARLRPFCSKRCADVDLNRWLSGAYAVPVAEEDGGASDDHEDEPA